MHTVLVLHAHGISPAQIKQAILDADTNLLTPGLLSALQSILPSKKEISLCKDYQGINDRTTEVSSQMLAHNFVVDMATIPRASQRVEALIARTDFEIKSSAIHQVL